MISATEKRPRRPTESIGNLNTGSVREARAVMEYFRSVDRLRLDVELVTSRAVGPKTMPTTRREDANAIFRFVIRQLRGFILHGEYSHRFT